MAAPQVTNILAEVAVSINDLPPQVTNILAEVAVSLTPITPRLNVAQSITEAVGFGTPSGAAAQVIAEALAYGVPSGIVPQIVSEAIAFNAGTSGIVPQVVAEVIISTTPLVYGTYAVGGWAAATLASGYTLLTADPFVTSQFYAQRGTTGLTYLGGASGSPNLWTLGGALVTGVTPTPVAAAWTPNGDQIFLSDPTAGILQVLEFSANTLTIQQNISIAGVKGAQADGTNTYALAAAAAGMVPLQATSSVWAPNGAPLPLAGASCVIPYGSGGTTLFAAGSTGVVQYNLVAEAWETVTTTHLPTAITALATDVTGDIYAVGAGAFYVLGGSGFTVQGSGSWSGTLGGAMAAQAQLYVTDPTNSLIRCFSPSGAAFVWPQQASRALPAGEPGIIEIGQTIFTYGSNGTSLYNFGKPYNLKQVRNGSVAIYSVATSSWTTLNLGVDHVPAAIGASPPDLIYAATYENDLYGINPSTLSIVSTGIVPQYPEQQQSVQLGTSSLFGSGGTLYTSNVMAGSVIGFTP